MKQTQKIKHSKVQVLPVKFYTPFDFDMQPKNQSAAIPSRSDIPQTQ